MPVVRGSCLCGGVKYEIIGPLMRSGHCHCSNCRKAQGAAFRSRGAEFVSKISGGSRGRG